MKLESEIEIECRKCGSDVCVADDYVEGMKCECGYALCDADIDDATDAYWAARSVLRMKFFETRGPDALARIEGTQCATPS